MARVTRSRKIDIAEDNTALACQVALPDSPTKQSSALTEISATMTTNTLTMDDSMVATELKGLKAAYRTAIGAAKKAKKSKGKKGKQGSVDESKSSLDLPEGLGTAAANPVPEPICQVLDTREEVVSASNEQQTKPTGRTTRRQAAKAQAAEDAFARSLNEKSAKPVLPEQMLYSTNHEKEEENKSRKEIEMTRTPEKTPAKTLEEVEKTLGALEHSPAPHARGDDSFVEQITSRSPAKPVSRIEDSLEALDQLEEAIEALDQAALVEKLVNTEKPKEKSHAVAPNGEMKNSGKPTISKTQAAKPGYSTTRVKPTAPKPTTSIKRSASTTFKPSMKEHMKDDDISLKRSASTNFKPSMKDNMKDGTKPTESQPKVTKAPSKRPMSLLPPKEPVKSTKPPTRPTFELPGVEVARKLKEQREARLAQRESSEDNVPNTRVVSQPKIKSTKPPTKPTFELPGEAYSRRKREAHEAKLKAQEEEERKRREFKARPVRTSILPDFVPRETVASLARRSKIGVESMENSEASISKRSSISLSNVGAHRPSISQLNLANSSAPRSKSGPPPARKPSPTFHGPSMSGRAMQRTVSTSEVQIQRQRAKEIYNRDARMAEDMEREKREREAAAKRAREEAAERGRQASREWAEKQMARKACEKAVSA